MANPRNQSNNQSPMAAMKTTAVAKREALKLRSWQNFIPLVVILCSIILWIFGKIHHATQGFDPATVNLPGNKIHFDKRMYGVSQRDADLIFLWETYKRTDKGSEKKAEILKQIRDMMKHREHLDSSVDTIGMFLFGPADGRSILRAIRVPGSPVVDDWKCLKSMVRLFEAHCGSLATYGLKHMRAFANICNNGVSEVAMAEASMAACGGGHNSLWSPLDGGYSA